MEKSARLVRQLSDICIIGYIIVYVVENLKKKKNNNNSYHLCWDWLKLLSGFLCDLIFVIMVFFKKNKKKKGRGVFFFRISGLSVESYFDFSSRKTPSPGNVIFPQVFIMSVEKTYLCILFVLFISYFLTFLCGPICSGNVLYCCRMIIFTTVRLS